MSASEPSSIDQLLQQGIAAAKSGSKDNAREILMRVVEQDEHNEKGWLWLSGVVESLEDRRICLENVLELNPENALALQGLRWLDEHAPPVSTDRCPHCNSPLPPSGTRCPQCHKPLIIVCPACGEHIDISEAHCPQCGQPLGHFRQGAEYYLALAEAYRQNDRLSFIPEVLAYAAQAAPNDPQVLQHSAKLYEDIGFDRDAISTYQRLITLTPDQAEPYLQLGAIYQRLKLPTEARAVYEQAAQHIHDNAIVPFELARLRIAAGEEALDLLQQAVQIDPGYAAAQLLLGKVQLDRGEERLAAPHFRAAIEASEPNSPIGLEARHKWAKVQPGVRQHSDGWTEAARRLIALMITPALAVLSNSKLSLLSINLNEWLLLIVALLGSFLWMSASDLPRNAIMARLFGQPGPSRSWRTIIGWAGTGLWLTAFVLMLIDV
jgi:tetratricopeptide (TPR) repeat protein